MLTFVSLMFLNQKVNVVVIITKKNNNNYLTSINRHNKVRYSGNVTPTSATAQSEYAQTPNAVIVHDPTRFQALNVLKHLNPVASQELFLFRACPDEEKFSHDHRIFAKRLAEFVPNVLYTADILTPDDHHEFRYELQRNPNLVYTRDAVITLPWLPDGFIVGNMGKPIRSEEPRLMTRVMERLNLTPILRTPDNMILEGGDVIPFVHNGERMLLVGFGRRTTESTLHFLKDELICKLGILDTAIGIELAPWRINLDGGMVPLANDVIVAHTDSLVRGLRLDSHIVREINPIAFLQSLGMHIIHATQEESLDLQSCNCFCVGKRTVIAYNLVPHIVEKMHAYGITVHTINGSELVKGTGGPRCMTRPIYKLLK